MHTKRFGALLTTMLFILFGCSSDANESIINISKDTEIVKIYKGNFYELYPEEIRDGINSYRLGGGSIYDKYIGLKLPRYNLKTLNDEKITFPETNFIVELSATFCPHCQNFTKEIMPSILEENKDFTIIQYFYDGDKDNINKFYEDAKTQIPENLIIVQENKSLNAWLESKDIISFPTFIAVDASGVVTFVGTGSSDINASLTLVKSLKDFILEDTCVENGTKILDFMQKQIKLREYINNLDEIEVPLEIFDEEIKDRGDKQDEKDNSTNCDKYCFNWMSKQATC